MEFGEFFISKVAFQLGYTDVYHDEFGSKKEIATPGKWITDSVAIGEFAHDYGFEIIEKDEGDFFRLEGEELQSFLSKFNKEIVNAENKLVDELLREKIG